MMNLMYRLMDSVFDAHAADDSESYKRYKRLLYQNFFLRAVLSFVLGVFFGYIVKSL